MLNEIIELLFGIEKPKLISDHIIINYLETIKTKTSLINRIENISINTANEIMDSILYIYSMYPNWIIKSFITNDILYRYTKKLLLNNHALVGKIEYLENIKITNAELYDLDQSYNNISVWQVVIRIVFRNLELSKKSLLWDIKHFKLMYFKFKEIYEMVLNNNLVLD